MFFCLRNVGLPVNSTLPVLVEQGPIFSCAKSGEKGVRKRSVRHLQSSFDSVEQKVKSNTTEGLFISPEPSNTNQSAAAVRSLTKTFFAQAIGAAAETRHADCRS